MEPNGVNSVQYDRWNEDNINMNVEESQIYNKMCTGNTGIAVKAIGGFIALFGAYLIGYVTGYYVHRC
uniref:Small integral membrane protein 1 n=1 Tax=Mola mola TaxID=94237 RepID=A0A3Q4BJA1_MOLML